MVDITDEINIINEIFILNEENQMKNISLISCSKIEKNTKIGKIKIFCLSQRCKFHFKIK